MKKLGIVAIVVSISLIFLLTSSQLVYAPAAPANRVTFSFNQVSGASGLDMQGGGMWIKGVVTSVKAAGGFNDSTTAGNWKATILKDVIGTCGNCDNISTSSPSSAAFSADFRDAGGAVTARDVIVATGDLCSCSGFQNFWVEGFGFGTANVEFH